MASHGQDGLHAYLETIPLGSALCRAACGG